MGRTGHCHPQVAAGRVLGLPRTATRSRYGNLSAFSEFNQLTLTWFLFLFSSFYPLCLSPLLWKQQYHKHLFVHIGGAASYSDPMLEVNDQSRTKKHTRVVLINGHLFHRRSISDKSTTSSPRRKADSRNSLIKVLRTLSSWWNSGLIWAPTSTRMQEHFTPSLHSKAATFNLYDLIITSVIIRVLIDSFPPAGTKATRTWPSRVRQKCARSANKSSRRWKRNTPVSRTAVSSTASIGRPCASTWSTLSTSSSTCPKSTWWTASSRTLPSCRYVDPTVSISLNVALYHLLVFLSLWKNAAGGDESGHARDASVRGLRFRSVHVGTRSPTPHLPVGERLTSLSDWWRRERRWEERQSHFIIIKPTQTGRAGGCADSESFIEKKKKQRDTKKKLKLINIATVWYAMAARFGDPGHLWFIYINIFFRTIAAIIVFVVFFSMLL